MRSLVWVGVAAACGTVSEKPDSAMMGGDDDAPADVDGAGGDPADAPPVPDAPFDADPACGDCGPTICVEVTNCAFEGDPTCDETGTLTESCVPRVCNAGNCEDGAPFNRTVDCTRTTAGVSCGATSCVDTSACMFEGDAMCDETGTKTRSCTSFTCVSSACQGRTMNSTASCSRETTGDFCDQVSCSGGNRPVCCSSTGTCTVIGTSCGPCEP